MSSKQIPESKETNAERTARLRYEFNKKGGAREQYWKAYAEDVKRERAKVGPGGKKGAAVLREYDVFPQKGRTLVRKWRSGKQTGGKEVDNLNRMESGNGPVTKDGYQIELHHKKELSQGGTNNRENLLPIHQTVHQKSRRALHQGIYGEYSVSEERNRRQEKVRRAERQSKAQTNRRGEKANTAEARSRSVAAKPKSTGQKRWATIPREGGRYGISVKKGRSISKPKPAKKSPAKRSRIKR